MSLTSGSRFGAYEVVSLLGAGGMGAVYKARDTRLDRSIAIKIMPAEVERPALLATSEWCLHDLSTGHLHATALD